MLWTSTDEELKCSLCRAEDVNGTIAPDTQIAIFVHICYVYYNGTEIGKVKIAGVIPLLTKRERKPYPDFNTSCLHVYKENVMEPMLDMLHLSEKQQTTANNS